MVSRRLAIVIPAHNERETIGEVVSAAKVFGDVIVVDDMSSDETAALAESAGATVIRSVGKLGYDGAINQGFLAVLALNQDFLGILTMDADGQHPTSSIGAFIRALSEGNDLVVGQREKRARFAEVLFGLRTGLTAGIFDPLSGMKAYGLDLVKSVGHFDCYDSIGTELMVHALKTRKRFVKLPITVQPRLDNPRFAGLIRANVKILRALVLSLTKRRGHVNS
jgi:glycosyltransferase involved in cell wall biosynthesis